GHRRAPPRGRLPRRLRARGGGALRARRAHLDRPAARPTPGGAGAAGGTRGARLRPRPAPRGLRLDLRHEGGDLMRRSKKRDAEAISYHYDQSNELYAVFADTLRVYACG